VAGTAEFIYIPEMSGLSGFVSTAGPSFVREAISADVATLDEVVDDQPVDILKVDVEGAELPGIPGRPQTLRTSRPVIVFEHARVIVDGGMTPGLGEPQYEINASLFELLVGELEHRLFDLDGWDHSAPRNSAVSMRLPSASTSWQDRRLMTRP